MGSTLKSDVQLTRVDRETLAALLLFGDNSRSNLSEICGRHPNSIGDARDRLEEQNLVFDKGGGVLALSIAGLRTAQGVIREFELDLTVPDYWEPTGEVADPLSESVESDSRY